MSCGCETRPECVSCTPTQQVVDRREVLGVGVDEQLAQPGDVGQGLLGHDELAGAAPALGADGDRLGAEDQLGAAQAPALPAPPGEVGGPAVGRAVPALHGQDGEAVADGAAVQRERLGERRVGARPHLGVERQLETERLAVAQQRLYVLNATDVAHGRLLPPSGGEPKPRRLRHSPAPGRRERAARGRRPPTVAGAERALRPRHLALASAYSSATRAPTLSPRVLSRELMTSA